MEPWGGIEAVSPAFGYRACCHLGEGVFGSRAIGSISIETRIILGGTDACWIWGNMNVTGKQESKICVMTWTVSETATRAAVVRCLHCADPLWPRHTAIIPLTQSPGGPCPHYPGQPRSPAKPGTSHSVAQTPQRGCWVQTNLLPYTTAEQSGEQTQLRW